MKHFLFLILFLTSSFSSAFATHNKAGEIIIKQLSYLNYQASIRTYTKASSITADRDSLEICWGDGICEWIQRDSSLLLGSNVKYNSYTAQHTYTNEDYFTISMTDPNRNGGILNVNPPSSDNVPFHIETGILVNFTLNNSPEFLNPPTDIGYVGQILQHNLAAIDWDGDSLVYELIVPFQGIGDPVPNYSFPDQISSGTNNAISIDETGAFMWNAPQLAGEYVVTFKITEFRNGNIISHSIRDVDFYIHESIDSLAIPTHNLPETNYDAELGDYINFDFNIGDNTSGEIQIRAFGLPFMIDNPASIILPDGYIDAPFSGSFSWTIQEGHQNLSPYYVVFRIDKKVDENLFHSQYHVIKITFDAPLSIFSPKQTVNFNVFPNPSLGKELYLNPNEFSHTEKTSLRIYDQSGKIVHQESLIISDKLHRININNLPSGTYFIHAESDNQTGVKKLIIP